MPRLPAAQAQHIWPQSVHRTLPAFIARATPSVASASSSARPAAAVASDAPATSDAAAPASHDPATQVGNVAWDPHNLFSESDPSASSGLIERRLAERRARQDGHTSTDSSAGDAAAAAPPAPPPSIPIQRVPPELVAAGGVPLAEAPGSDKGPTYAAHVAMNFLPLNASDTRIRVRRS